MIINFAPLRSPALFELTPLLQSQQPGGVYWRLLKPPAGGVSWQTRGNRGPVAQVSSARAVSVRSRLQPQQQASGTHWLLRATTRLFFVADDCQPAYI
jgi:hypothetical protein